ncbi:MAG: hypothetical protein Q7S22_01325 [Candidatus Micrarchaeota archaeon]|nr:hypothetical protein [Candidatus Micrarchaeota archaeon]
MRKLYILLVLAVVFSLVLAGCAQKLQPEPIIGTPVVDEKKVVGEDNKTEDNTTIVEKSVEDKKIENNSSVVSNVSDLINLPEYNESADDQLKKLTESLGNNS